MSKLCKLSTVMVLFLYLIGCGGGGSGGGGDDDDDFPTPALPADARTINEGNARDTAESALLFTEAIASVSAKTEGPSSIPQVIKLVSDQVTIRNRNLGSLAAGREEDVSGEFCDEGEAIDTYTEGANSITGNLKFTDCAIFGFAVVNGRVIVKSGVWAIDSSGDLVVRFDFDSIFKLDSSDHLRQIIEAA